MGFRFGKSIKLGKGFRINLSKSGIGMSAGIKGLRAGIGPRGSRLTASIPGTGISYVAQSGKRKKTTNISPLERANYQQYKENPQINWNLTPQLEKELLQGLNLYQSGEMEKSLPYFYSVSHKDGIGYFFAAIIFASTKQNNKAIEWLETLIKADVIFPTYLMQKYNLNESLLKLQVTSKLLVTIPLNNLGASLFLTELYQNQNRTEEAIGLLEQIREEVKNTILDLSLCELYFVQNINDGVIEIGKDNLVVDNCTFEIAVMYGQVLQKKKLHEGAIQIFTEALRKKNGMEKELIAEAMYWRANSYEKTGKKSQAKKELEKIYAILPQFKDTAEKLGIQEIKKFCGNCGQKIIMSSNFCANCGSSI